MGHWPTSVLNLIEHFLKRGSGRSRITLIRFNPRWFSASADGLLRAFFAQILASLA
jgi:predicted KAP-like P-loop ATPase